MDFANKKKQIIFDTLKCTYGSAQFDRMTVICCENQEKKGEFSMKIDLKNTKNRKAGKVNC